MKKNKTIDLDRLSDEELLSLRFCELGLQIEGTPLEGCIGQLHKELAEKGITFHPPCYLADEWLCPDGEPVIGIAFFLAHPRLKKLEHRMMMEVEGADKASCMKLLRHEMGHVINYAYFLYKRKRWRQLFGSFFEEYPDKYKYRPYSKRFVRHLEEWYAQYHPDEDFAETFAVWLDPGSDWKEKYKGWKALEKLRYIDGLMREIAGVLPRKPAGKKYWEVSRMKSRLQTHYRQKKDLYAENFSDFHDFHLNAIFPAGTTSGKEQRIKAHKLIRHFRKEILNNVAAWTGEKKYIISDLLKSLIARCRELDMETAVGNEADTILKIAVYVTAQTMNYLYTGRYKKKREKTKSTRHI
jgi:hypothetical protein